MGFIPLDKSTSKIAPTASFHPLGWQPAPAQPAPASDSFMSRVGTNLGQEGIGAAKFGATMLSTADVLKTFNQFAKGDTGSAKANALGQLQGVNSLASFVRLAGKNPDWTGMETIPQSTTPAWTGQTPEQQAQAFTPSNTAQNVGFQLTNAALGLAPLLREVMNPPKPPTKIPVQSTEEATPININTPNTKHAAYAASQGYEPYTPDNQLPTIQMGPKATQSTPTIRAESPTLPAPAGMKVVPEAASIFPETPSRTSQTLKPIEGTGPIKTRGLSAGVEATAIEKKLADNFGDLPEYRQVSMKDQAMKAADFISKDPDGAFKVAMGEKAPPKGVLPESVFVAAEQKAIQEGDVQAMRDLANSKLSGSATTMGQRIRTLGERDKASPVGAIQEIQKAREAAQAKRSEQVSKTIEKTYRAVKKSTNTVSSWSEFTKSITC